MSANLGLYKYLWTGSVLSTVIITNCGFYIQRNSQNNTSRFMQTIGIYLCFQGSDWHKLATLAVYLFHEHGASEKYRL